MIPRSPWRRPSRRHRRPQPKRNRNRLPRRRPPSLPVRTPSCRNRSPGRRSFARARKRSSGSRVPRAWGPVFAASCTVMCRRQNCARGRCGSAAAPPTNNSGPSRRPKAGATTRRFAPGPSKASRSAATRCPRCSANGRFSGCARRADHSRPPLIPIIMSAATKSSTPTAPAAVAPLAPAEAEQLARAEAYLKIEEYVSKQDGVFTKRLADEEEKLFKDLSAIPDLSANTRATDLIKVYFTVGVQVSADRTNLHRFSDLLRKRMSELSAEKTNMLRYALEQRIKALSET